MHAASTGGQELCFCRSLPTASSKQGFLHEVATLNHNTNPGLMTRRERAEWDRGVGPATAAFASLYRRHAVVARAVRDFALTGPGGWALFWAVLRPLALNAKRTMAAPDVACLDGEHPEYFQACARGFGVTAAASASHTLSSLLPRPLLQAPTVRCALYTVLVLMTVLEVLRHGSAAAR